jgi:hypothetical protein
MSKSHSIDEGWVSVKKRQVFGFLLTSLILAPVISGAVSIKKNNHIDITDYGAVADGNLGGGGTDNTAAIQAAITDALKQKKDLYIPTCKGLSSGAMNVYIISDELVINEPHSGFRIIGDGQGNSLIFQKTPGKNGIRITPHRQAAGLTLEGFSLWGRHGNRKAKGICIVRNASGQLSELSLLNMSANNFETACYVEFIDQSRIINCSFGGSTYGLDMGNGAINGLTISGCALNGCDTSGLRIDTGRGIVISGNDLGGVKNAGGIIQLTGGQIEAAIFGNSFEIWAQNVSVVKVTPKDTLAKVAFHSNNVKADGEGIPQKEPVISVNNQDSTYATIMFMNNLIQNYYTDTPAVRYRHAYANGTGAVFGNGQPGGEAAANYNNSVQIGTGASINQIGPFPFVSQQAARENNAYTAGNLTWFTRSLHDHYPYAKEYIADDLQAVYSGYDKKGKPIFRRTSLFNDKIIHPLERWKAAHPITSRSTLQEVTAALEALQVEIGSMAPYPGQ